jgi:hypothetical protein
MADYRTARRGGAVLWDGFLWVVLIVVVGAMVLSVLGLIWTIVK